MPVALALMLKELRAGARGAEGGVREAKLGQTPLGVEWMAQADNPARLLFRQPRARAAGDHAAQSAMKEKIVHASRRELLGAAVQGIALPNGAEIDFHAGAGKSDGLCLTLDHQMPAADELPRGRHFG